MAYTKLEIQSDPVLTGIQLMFSNSYLMQTPVELEAKVAKAMQGFT